jgi:Xaa-Pro aminopeptidase
MDKIDQLRKLLKKYNIDAYIVPSNDEFQSEYVTERRARLKYLTNFSGSNGLALITQTAKIFFTDGRYLLQAEKELDSGFQIIEYTVVNFQEAIFNLSNNANFKIGFDPQLHSVDFYNRFLLDYTNCIFTPVTENLVDSIWSDNQLQSLNNIFIYDIKYAGQDIDYKKKNTIKYLQKENIDAYIITALDSISWLLNLRQKEFEYNPNIFGYLIAYKTGKMTLFLESQPSIEIITYLKQNQIDIKLFNELSGELKKLTTQKIQLSPSSSYWFIQQLPNAVLKPDPCELPKACKNQVEINGAIEAHLQDAIALTEFLCWLEQNYQKTNITELSATEKLLEFRKQQPNFIAPSFATIMGFAENGAIVHYHSSEKTNKNITGNNLLLIDSGGQYYGGTTDVTRVAAIGIPTAEQIHNFTLVLKGHINLAAAVFPYGTRGSQLDSLARSALWLEGKNYAHGTGHGVGNFLFVHEGPQRIRADNMMSLQPGMTLSIEPGYYQTNAYGIRIENLVFVNKADYSNFLRFEPLTKVFIEPRLVDFSILTQLEKKWLHDYHQDVFNSLYDRLTPSTRTWLEEKINYIYKP